jgi:hypothetical protein
VIPAVPSEATKSGLGGGIIHGMITIALALLLGSGMSVAIWAVVRRNVIKLWGKNTPLTFTPPAFRPALDSNGDLLYDANEYLVQVPTGDFVSFEPRHERYMKIAEVVTTLASASLIFVPCSRLNVYPRSCASL